MSKGKKNLYRCNTCHKNIVTLDVDEGTTPFMLSCKATPGCKGHMQSSFYSCDQSLPHEFEFFRPKSFTGYPPEMMEHFALGGLDFRRVGGESMWKEKTQPRRRRRSK